MASEHRNQGRLTVGIILMVLGALFFLRNYDILDFIIPDFIFTWEYFFIGIGVILLLVARNKTAGVIFIGIGLFNLVPNLWPLILVGIGLYLIMRKGHHYKIPNAEAGENQQADFTAPDSFGKETINEVSIFGGGSKILAIDNFRGGSITSIFGGSEINLSQCKLADGVNYLEITAIFGGSTMIIPKDWKVEIDLIPIFGGFGDKRIKDLNMVYDDKKILVIKGTVIFGGGEIKN